MELCGIEEYHISGCGYTGNTFQQGQLLCLSLFMGFGDNNKEYCQTYLNNLPTFSFRMKHFFLKAPCVNLTHCFLIQNNMKSRPHKQFGNRQALSKNN